MNSLTAQLGYATADLPGIGGAIKRRAEDFLVDEQALYAPSGTGEHLYLLIQRHNQTTSDVVRRLAKVFGVRRSDVGYAGLKDKHAVTRQHFSVWLPEAGSEAVGLQRLEGLPLQVLWAERHGNKLRRGHLSGNRFVIRVREVEAASAVRAKRVLDRLSRTGVPNFFGRQRFGYRQDNDALGRLLIRGQWSAFLSLLLGGPRGDDPAGAREAREAYDRGEVGRALELWPRGMRHDRQALDALRQGKSAEEAVRAIDPVQRELLGAALQSRVFNAVLDRRLREGKLDRLLSGDLAWKHDSRSVFAVDEATAAEENAAGGRVGRMAVSPSGPMWGPLMPLAGGEALAREREELERQGLTVEEMTGPGQTLVRGERRSMREAVRDADVSGGVDEHGSYVRVSFELPRGVFATTVLREVMKNDGEEPEEGGG